MNYPDGPILSQELHDFLVAETDAAAKAVDIMDLLEPKLPQPRVNHSDDLLANRCYILRSPADRFVKQATRYSVALSSGLDRGPGNRQARLMKSYEMIVPDDHYGQSFLPARFSLALLVDSGDGPPLAYSRPNMIVSGLYTSPSIDFQPVAVVLPPDNLEDMAHSAVERQQQAEYSGWLDLVHAIVVDKNHG